MVTLLSICLFVAVNLSHFVLPHHHTKSCHLSVLVEEKQWDGLSIPRGETKRAVNGWMDAEGTKPMAKLLSDTSPHFGTPIRREAKRIRTVSPLNAPDNSSTR